MTSLRERAAARQQAAEERLAAATWRAMQLWLRGVRTALTARGMTAAGEELPPDPAVAQAADVEWAALARQHIVTAVDQLLGEVFAETLAEHGVVSARAWQEAYLAEVPNRVVGLPDEAFTLLREALQEGIDAGSSIPTIRDAMARVLSATHGGAENFWRRRAAAIARTEATSALNGGQLAAWRERDALVGLATDKFWIATIDARTRDDHMAADGQRVPMDGQFSVGGSRMDHPGDPKAPAAQRVNCRCSLGEVPAGNGLPDVDDRQLARTAESDPVPAEVAARAARGVVRARDGGLTAAPDTAVRTAPGSTENAVTAAGGDTTMPKRWSGLLAPIGVNSGDRRRLAAGGEFSFRDLPLPLLFQESTADGHDTAVVVGRILAVDIREDGIYGEGDYLEAPEFAEHVNKAIALVDADMGHVSVDLADVVAELVDENGEPIVEADLWAAMERGEPLPEIYDQFTVAKLIGCTQVSKPAFAEARISLSAGDTTAAAEATVETVVAAAEATTELERGVAAALDAATFATAALADSEGTTIEVGDSVVTNVADGEETKEVRGTVSETDEGAGTVTVKPEAEDAAPVVAKAEQVRVTEKAEPADAGDEDEAAAQTVEASADDAVLAAAAEVVDTAAEQLASLSAAAGMVQTWRPDAECFANPDLAGKTPMTVGPVQPDGTRRVFGHLATWDTCHIGHTNQCVTPPRESDFSYFHVGEVELADGTALAVGNLTLGGRHANVQQAYRDAVRHYDDSGAGVAVVRAYADEFGIAVAGVITPETTELQLAQLRRSVLSGDWRRIGGSMRLCGALAVNTGGFPVPRTQYAVDGAGRQTSLVAAGIVPLEAAAPESFEEVARRVFADETQKAARRDAMAKLALVASAAEREAAQARRAALSTLVASATESNRAALAGLLAEVAV